MARGLFHAHFCPHQWHIDGRPPLLAQQPRQRTPALQCLSVCVSVCVCVRVGMHIHLHPCLCAHLVTSSFDQCLVSVLISAIVVVGSRPLALKRRVSSTHVAKHGSGAVVHGGGIHRRTVEKMVGVPVPWIREYIDEVVGVMAGGEVSGRTSEQIVDVPVPEIMEDAIEKMIRLAPQEQNLGSTLGIINILVSHAMEEITGSTSRRAKCKIAPWSKSLPRSCHRFRMKSSR